MALAFCEAVGLEPGEIAVVGDAVHDLAMGRAARRRPTVGVLSGTGTAAQLEPLADIDARQHQRHAGAADISQVLVAAALFR